ncbi:LysR family transcriptional regulator [Gordonia desulfuricans]|uniref:LysR family transcriptional regulator n=1 Tax=Gordonia desulfuricans TaxID=89051 RepID=A0A7K3LKX1_9ACTN|nr:LysR family transcriptional regulator [Gordonia desulfuricans]NDK88187.1 LysR family transcriptional regulator [Gordonia desulfuricans]
MSSRDREIPLLVDLRRLHHFVAAVEAPTLRVAAAELSMTQQGLSSSLRRLETDLGVELFTRSGRSLQMNQAGRVLYHRASALLAGGRLTVDALLSATHAATVPFVIGHTSEVSGEEAYGHIGPASARMPLQRFKVIRIHPDQVRDELRSGSLDLALQRAVDATSDLESTVVGHHTLRVVVSVGHPLATRKVVDTTDLAEFPLIVSEPDHTSRHTDFLVSWCRRQGFEPTLLMNPIDGFPLSAAVAADTTACAFVTEPPGHTFGGRVLVLDLRQAPQIPLHAVWSGDTTSPVRRAFLGA